MFNLATKEPDYTAEHAAIDARQDADSNFQAKRAKLQLEVELAKDAQTVAANRKTFLENRVNHLLEQAIGLWGHPDSDTLRQQPPLNTLVDCFITINAIRSALLSFPKAEEQLRARLASATKALNDHQRYAPGK